MYVNHYDRHEKLPEENPTIGILLCASKNNEMVKLSLPENNRSIMASQYQLYLPSESQLLDELKKEIQQEEIRRINDENASSDTAFLES